MTPRPVFLDLRRIGLPIGAIASLLHRVSGILLVLALPPAALWFERSLASAAAFESSRAALGSWPGRFALVLLAWALAHHVLAGVRHLLMDSGVGARLPAARRSAAFCLAAAGLVAAVAALFAWWPR
ncbi:succinate dehydrogenase, cytochrome b556 subunit [Quisquiliibacterium transsilvanicum]|uniref:Succinate dehydrogenase cytochrome b556 subunit n=1 Tax=Quisquiliibacterium transsilvanicum TaxID=1549638 RepID=A0A7W8M9H7_9BURK|nr:succinate dehydrogenase, cytochrome b556 subunit [Quisquiliibacterium transsilvanicum]MBB5272893.1 succinate dehydrogenase / fumarate reductase cytochrome b subunit [Quisquiliibacterium transsilvanicum]